MISFNKYVILLKIQIFIAGASIMSLEIMNSRILAPYFGNSLYVWGSLIGVVLSGLSIGYYYGGRKADINPKYSYFCIILLGAGLYSILTTFGSTTIFSFVLSTNLGERFSPLLASTLILGVPSILLGMVSPYAIKLTTKKIEIIGKSTGNLYSLSTLGSIFGTFLTTFYLIPETSLTANLYGVSIVLIATSLFGLTLMIKPFAVLSIFICVLLIFTPQSNSFGIVEKRDTLYHRLIVTDDNLSSIRTLILDNNFHSAMDLKDTDRVVYLYTGLFHLGFAYNPDIIDVLFIGGGGFSGPKRFLQDYSNVKIDVVEIDPDVIDISKLYFNVSEDPRMNIYVNDGRVFLRTTDQIYDLIVLDAYGKTYVPFHLMTKEFHQLISDHLSDNGVLVFNIITSLDGSASELFKAELKTMKEIYPIVDIYQVSNISSDLFVQNVIIIAHKNVNSLSNQELIANSQNIISAINTEEIIKKRYTENLDLSDSIIITDDYAPVMDLLNPVTGKLLIKEIILNNGTISKIENVTQPIV